MLIIRRSYLTLMEIMVVILLIMMIMGVIAYNYSGSLDEGKAFKTKAAIEKVDNILNMEIAKDPSLMNDIESDWTNLIKRSKIVKNPDDLIYDGWGNKLEVEVEDDKINVHSKKLDEYVRKARK
ncbi:MAG: hypothetical protein ACK4HV_00835 [Parachlamydiaceae bacterium]